eukprot:TRINITY_DN23689_c0_g1_i1.p1 TRINITY_DN23689_c0_g1~~TRINITY_DN23689_c0_g1_i1.p1  ORF type:complete len:353 (+),score=65.62 TRINITY_DN23689_c0_g1_i1:74-1132(+)
MQPAAAAVLAPARFVCAALQKWAAAAYEGLTSCGAAEALDELAADGVDCSPSQRFEPGDPAAREFFAEYGYVVFKGAAAPGDIAEANRLLWDWLRHSGMLPACPHTWGAENFPGNPANGVIVRDGMGQSEFMWHLRSLPGVRAAYATLWGTDDLIASLDGACVFRPWGRHPEWRTGGGWFHVDQGPTRRGFQGMQGVLTLRDADESTGGLVVVPGSHLQHESLCERCGPRSAGLGVIEVEAGHPCLVSGSPRLVCMRAGDLAVFDCRTVHCNYPGNGPARNASDFVRAAGYVGMMPRSRASEAVLIGRREAFASGQTLNHWPDECHPLSGAFAAARRAERPPLTPQQLQLLG